MPAPHSAPRLFISAGPFVIGTHGSGVFFHVQHAGGVRTGHTQCQNARMPGTLYIVSTPIGNLEDITQRALRVLREVDLIACEDTRHTRQLLNHFSIDTRTISYHEHNERERAEELCKLLEEGKSIALVSDAGTPLISDPGFRIVNLAGAKGFPIVPVPGATAFVAALAASGLASDQVLFAGFCRREQARAGQSWKSFAPVRQHSSFTKLLIASRQRCVTQLTCSAIVRPSSLVS